MSFEVTGILIEKYPAVDVSGKFRKREFVISKTENNNGFEFTDYIKFQLTQERCNLVEQFSPNEKLKVSFNLRGRKWEKDGTVTYFTNLEAWKIDRISGGESETDSKSPFLTDDSIPLPGDDDMLSPVNGADDLPF